MASGSTSDPPSLTIENIFNCLVSFAAHPAAQECNSYPLCTEVLSMFHRNAIAGSSRGELAIFIACPQPAFRDGSIPDLATYLAQPAVEDGGPVSRSRRGRGPPGELGPWWEVKKYVKFMEQYTLYGSEYMKCMGQLVRYSQQAFEDFPSRRAFYSFFSAGLGFTLLLWPNHEKTRFDASRVKYVWVKKVVETLKAALNTQLSDWKDDHLAEYRSATGNSTKFRDIEKRCLAQITVRFLLKVSPIPIYWRQNMFVGRGQDRALSPQFRNALLVAHSLPDLGLMSRDCPDFEIPANAAAYNPTPGTMKEACHYTARAIFMDCIKGWDNEFEDIRPPDGGSAVSSNNNYKGRRQHGDLYQPIPPLNPTHTRITRSTANGGGGQAVAGPGPGTMAARARNGR
ncbi:hypothetical protein PENSPDRAFT_749079 [Peniophora sp. CONT]|nr:hypothetical protein PENSPDRAFT_749079 [Peniophora sp. CONT]